jgi:hypothetical protein
MILREVKRDTCSFVLLQLIGSKITEAFKVKKERRIKIKYPRRVTFETSYRDKP